MKFRQTLIRTGALALVLGLLNGCANTPPSTTAAISNWQTLEQITPGFKGVSIKVETNASTYRINDPIRFQVTSSHPGKLWIVEVNQRDVASVLLPNARMTNNLIRAGVPMTVPDSSWGLDLRASAPAGRSQVVFFVTPPDMTLDDIAQIDNGKISTVAFPSNKAWGLQRVFLNISN